MKEKYLYLEKKQRIKTDNKLSRRATRILEELDELDVEFQISHLEDLSISMDPGGIIIRAAGENILGFSHIIFGGHHLHTNGYEIKRMIVDLADQWNIENPREEIKVQNGEFIKKLPFYSKLNMAKICLDNGLPHLQSYYLMSGEYVEDTGPIEYPLIAKHVLGENDLVPIDGKLKVKKNVYLVGSEDDWEQERLSEKELGDFFTQEFTETGEDVRLFIAQGEVIGGWKRIAPKENFMTVTKGAIYKYYNEPDKELIDISTKAAQLWDADFMALDFIYKDGKPYILEFSMNPGFHAYENKCEDGEPTNIAHYIVRAF